MIVTLMIQTGNNRQDLTSATSRRANRSFRVVSPSKAPTGREARS
jgi:hypothetical protein